jgi:hypothetical protein
MLSTCASMTFAPDAALSVSTSGSKCFERIGKLNCWPPSWTFSIHPPDRNAFNIRARASNSPTSKFQYPLSDRNALNFSGRTWRGFQGSFQYPPLDRNVFNTSTCMRIMPICGFSIRPWIEVLSTNEHPADRRDWRLSVSTLRSKCFQLEVLSASA